MEVELEEVGGPYRAGERLDVGLEYGAVDEGGGAEEGLEGTGGTGGRGRVGRGGECSPIAFG